jgi:hypothetical protein
MELSTGHRTNSHLLAHSDYSSIANCRVISSAISWYILEFSRHLKVLFIYSIISRGTLTIFGINISFGGNLAEKHGLASLKSKSPVFDRHRI